MKINLKIDSKKAIDYLNKLIKSESIIELKKVHKLRTNQQNRYLHKALSLFAIYLGYNLHETKCYVKFETGYYELFNDFLLFEQTSKMNTKEMTMFIEKFRIFASAKGYDVPSPDEYNGRFEFYEKEIENNREYL